jgi:hypothetical protein
MPVSRFNRLCSLIGLSFLLLVIGTKSALYEYKHIPPMQDFPQYYMGGLMALHGEWDSMYPIPNPGSHTNPGFVGNSTLRPKYRELALSHGVTEESVRYMQPPPLALLLVPLALVPVKVSYYAWVLLLIFAAWGIGRQAGSILEICLGHPTRGSGLMILLVCCSMQAIRWVSVGNMSVLIGWLIGYSVIELVRRDGARGAIAMALGTIAKYAMLVLGPLQIAMRRWRTIAWETAITLAIVAISYVMMGRTPFDTFAHEIAPTLGRTSTVPENSGIYIFLMRIRHIDDDALLPHSWLMGFRAAEMVSLLVILALVLLHPRRFWELPHRVFAGAVALMAWLLLFSPIFWEHYHAYLAPFWGWLGYEATRTRTRAIVAGSVIVLGLFPRVPFPLLNHLMWSTLIMLAFAIVRLSQETAASK